MHHPISAYGVYDARVLSYASTHAQTTSPAPETLAFICPRIIMAPLFMIASVGFSANYIGSTMPSSVVRHIIHNYDTQHLALSHSHIYTGTHNNQERQIDEEKYFLAFILWYRHFN